MIILGCPELDEEICRKALYLMVIPKKGFLMFPACFPFTQSMDSTLNRKPPKDRKDCHGFWTYLIKITL
jgi:hypothetical protein